MDDLVITAVSEYGYEKLKPWVMSLNECGFTGRKAIICFNILDDTIEKLIDEDIEIILAANKRNNSNTGYVYADGFTYHVPKFRHLMNWFFLRQMKDIRYVISTDCADVVFQSNPSEWLEKNIGDKKLNYGGESLKYENEPWGYDNMLTSFGPTIQEYMKSRPIYNAGSMAGEFQTFVDFSLAVYLSIMNNKNPMPDQAGVNLLLSLEPYKSITKFNSHDSNWACQCGTTVDPNKIDSFRPFLLSPEPKFRDGYAYTSTGEKYVLVHQYNRVPEWKNIIEKKYE
jgi:hypothetical protein